MIAKKSEIMAKQSLNAMYKDSVGASKQEEIIRVFGSLWLPLAIISVAISTFSIYMDLSIPLGFGLSLIIGLFFAFVLVVFTHYALDSLFTTFTGLSKAMMAVIFVGLAVISIIAHFKSLNNFEKIMVQDKRVSILKMNMATSETANEQIKKVLATNQALTRVFNNGTIHDDKIAMNSMSSNNQLIALLKTTSQNQTLQKEIIHEEKKLAKTLKDTLFLLFIVLEVMSYFSLVSKILLALNTSEEVKNLTTHLSKLEEIEANVYDVVVTKKTEEVTNNVNRVLEKVSNHPTPIYATAQNYQNSSQNQQNKAQIAFNTNSSSNLYNSVATSDYKPFLGYSQNLRESKPKIDNNACVPCSKEIEENLKNKTNSEKPKNKILDLMKYNYQDSQIILALFDNGAIQKGDRLVKKSLVLAELEEQGVKEDDYVTLLRKLRKQKLVRFDVGYFSECDLENIVKNH